MQLHTWLSSSFVRHFPSTSARRAGALRLEGARNEQFSFQVGLRLDAPSPAEVAVQARGPDGWSVRVRRVGYVPMQHHNFPVEGPADTDGQGCVPGYVPDPLFDEDRLVLAPDETHAFWITVRPDKAAAAGDYSVDILVKPEAGREQQRRMSIQLHDIELAKRQNFRVTHWFYVDALMDWYQTAGFDRRFWSILPAYVRNVAAHGQDTLYVPVFTPPLDGVKRPSQLLRVTRAGRDSYRFDWRDVRRYVALAKRCGINHLEWCHPFSQWGARHAIRVYEGQGRDESLLWKPETAATSPTYRRFLAQYLPALHRFLQREHLLKRSFFHVSDEPHAEEHLHNYRAARAMLQELAPWMKVMDALSEIVFAREQLTDMPIPGLEAANDFVREGIPCWCYYCCGPRGKYLNRFMDTPLAKIAMHGFLFYRWPTRGFLHWGYNYWHECGKRNLVDPFTVQDGKRWPGWAYGDPFVVYPGRDGPIDSMRWEVFGESLQDYQLLQTLGVEREAPFMAKLRSFADFPKDPAWRRSTRASLLSRTE